MGVEYDDIAESFARSRETMEWEELERIAARAIAAFPKGNFRVLDLGCGSGRLYPVLSRFFGSRLSYLGTDVSRLLIAQAKKAHPGADFRVADMRSVVSDTALAQETFDAVFAIASFHHLLLDEDRRTTLRGIFAALKPEGMFAMANWDLFSESNVSKYAHCRREGDIFEIKFGKGMRTYSGLTSSQIDALLRSEKFLRAETDSNGRNLVTLAWKG